MIKKLTFSLLLLTMSVYAQDNWEQKFPNTSPAPRFAHAMADIGSGDVLLFGGIADLWGNTLYYDTWIYNLTSNTWTLKTPSSSPNLIVSAMASIGNDKVLLFGGFSDVNNSTKANQTWVYDLDANSWILLSPDGGSPAARSHHSMAYIGDDKVLLFGGYDGDEQPLTDTWIFDLSDNTWTQMVPEASPSLTYAPQPITYVGGDQVVLLSAGTWLYDLSVNEWTLKSEAMPSVRTIALIAGTDQILGFGSTSFPYPSSHRYDLSENIWSTLVPTTTPPYHEDQVMASLGNGKVLMFGGLGLGYGGFSRIVVNDTWVYSANVQTPLSITSNPTSTTQCSGQPVVFSVTATGSGLMYQWRKNGNPIGGATSDSYTISSVTAGDAASYDVVVTDAYSVIQTSTAAILTVLNAPVLAFSGNPNFTASTVFPSSAGPTAGFRFEMTYTDPDGNLPQVGDPKIHLDYEGNGIFTDANDLNMTLYPLDVNDLDVTDGKRYYIEVPTLPFGTNYKVTFTATNTNDCSSAFGPENGPSVITAPNLAIYANDISFSNPHPGPGSEITVSAVVRNLTPTAASNFSVRLVNQAFPLTSNPDILIPSLAGNSTTTISWAITTPNAPSWNPMQVIVDHGNTVGETNELDNQAIRPFVNGNYSVGGGIAITASPSPAEVCPAPHSSIHLCGSAQYFDTSVPLQDPGVAGATVTIHMAETDQTFSGTTDASGHYCIQVPAPISSGQYHLEVSVTDYTISGIATSMFTVLSSCTINGPDLISSISVSASEIFAGGSITGSVTVTNVGNQASTASTTSVSAPNGTPPMTGNYATPALGVGLSHSPSFGPVTFTTPGYYTISATANATLSADETNYSNNNSSRIIRVCPNVPDLAAQYLGTLQSYRCDPLVMTIPNNTCLPVNAPFTATLEVMQNNAVIGTHTKTVTTAVPRDGQIPVSFTNVFPAAGVYQVQFTVDDANVIAENDEYNNVYSNSFLVMDCKPDLNISPACTPVAGTDPQYPGTITINTTLTNSGNAPAVAPFVVDFEVNGNHYPMTISNNLNNGNSVNVPVTIPTPPFGCAVLNIVADIDDVVDEIVENNNTRQVKLSWDFSLGSTQDCIGELSFWEKIQHVGIPVSLSAGLFHSGDYKASLVATQYEVSGPGITGWFNLGTSTNANIGPCSCSITTLPTPYIFLQTGTYYVRMTTDATSSYTECDENNNVLVVSVEVVQTPDYRILSEYIAPSLLNPAIAQPIDISVTYENIGNTGSNEMVLGVKVDEIQHDQQRVSSLAQNTNNTVLFSNQWASVIPGVHVIRGIVDANDEIPEASEANNQATRTIVVGPTANLAFAQFEASDHSPALNSPIAIQTVIQNTGPIDCIAELKVYYTDNNNAEVLFSQQPVSVLANGSLSVPIPWSVLNTHATLIGKLVNFSVPQASHSGKEAQDAIGNTCTATITASGPTTFCGGGSVVLTASDGISWLWSTNETTRSITITSTGDYSVTVTDASLCTATSAVTHVTVHPLPIVTVTPSGPTTFCQGESVTLTATGADSYVWSNAATTASITVDASGSYSVYGTDGNGCSASSAPIPVVVLPTVSAGTVSGTSTLCVGSTATFTSNGTTGGTWTSSNTSVATVDLSSGLVSAVSAGTAAITYALSSGCGSPASAYMTVEVNACQTFCTYTQGYYGNNNRISLINTLLPITIGKPGRSLTFEANQGACVASRLPAGGQPTALPSTLGDYSVGMSACPQNTVIPLLSSNRFDNVLLGQTITLTLNTRMSSNLATFVLPSSFCTQQDQQSAINGPFVIPQSVLGALSNLSLTQTVGGLLELANRALAGLGTGGATLSNINDAMNAINVGFDECRTVATCPIPKEPARAVEKEIVLYENYPNPFNPMTTISYCVPEVCQVALKVFDGFGRLVSELENGMKAAGTHSVVFHTRDLPSGVYFYRLEANQQVRFGTMTLQK